MSQDDLIGILMILGVISIAAFGGVKNYSSNNYANNPNLTQEQKIELINNDLSTLEQQIRHEKDKAQQSQYSDLISISYANRNTDQNQEYVTIKFNKNYRTDPNTSIPISGWTLKSVTTLNSVTIPKATYLFRAGQLNNDETIFLKPDDTLYLTTGMSPNGTSFKTNKCSGYLTQFQTFIPYISSNCPLPKNEALSQIGKSGLNDVCLDLLDKLPMCKIYTEKWPDGISSECMKFISEKLNYNSCIDNHKNDKDFYGNEWRVYLKRSEPLWKPRREVLILYDNVGKVVDTLQY